MLDDQKLYSLLTTNPGKGLAKVMDRYLAYVYTIVAGRLSGVCPGEDIEECVSDVFYEFYRTRAQIDLGKGSLKAYLAVLSKRRAIDAYRRLRRTADKLSLDESAYYLEAAGASVEQQVVNKESADRIVQGIKGLGEPDSQIIIRKFYFGQTSKVIAQALGLKENTVNKKVSRGLEKLKSILGGELHGETNNRCFR